MKKKGYVHIALTMILFLAYFLILAGPAQSYFIDRIHKPAWMIMLAISILVGAVLSYLSYAAAVYLSNIDLDKPKSGAFNPPTPKKMMKVGQYLVWWVLWVICIFIFNMIWLSEL